MKGDIKFLGSATLGERGQVVVPAEARELLGVKAGDKLLVFKAPVDGALVLAKPEVFEQHVQHMSERASMLQEQIKEAKDAKNE